MLSRDEVLRIAEEAGFGRLLPAFGSIPSCWHGQDIGLLEQFAALAYQRGVRDERESCAKVCDLEANEARMVRKVEGDLVGLFLGHRVSALDAAAAAIRARNKEST